MENNTFPFQLQLQHMNEEARMERLYNFLLQMGLVVFPIYNSENPNKISHLNVSIALPFKSQNPSEIQTSPVRAKDVKRAKIIKRINTAKHSGSKVINIPPKT